MQLGYWPRVTIKHTSGQAEGQIYVPEVSFAMMVACIGLVLAFQDSSRFASAYGIAVTGTMTATSILFYGVARGWGWSPLVAGPLVALFLSLDLAFFSANVHKIAEGGWFPLVVGVAIFTLMTTWRRGRELLGEAFRSQALPLDVFMADLAATGPHRVAGTAVFMTSNPSGVPAVLLHFFKHGKVLHEQVLFLSIATRHVPEIAPSARERSGFRGTASIRSWPSSLHAAPQRPRGAAVLPPPDCRPTRPTPALPRGNAPSPTDAGWPSGAGPLLLHEPEHQPANAFFDPVEPRGGWGRRSSSEGSAAWAAEPWPTTA